MAPYVALLLCLLASLLTTPASSLPNPSSPLLPPSPPASSPSTTSVSTVHVIISNHLDVGFNTVGTDPWRWLAADVLDEYFRTYFPRALQVARDLAAMVANGTNPHNDTLTWTTHPWLVSLYLDCPPDMGYYCPTEEEKAAFIGGVQDRTVTWHAFPFNGEMELLTPDLLHFAVELARDLAVRTKRPGPLPNTVSQRDVPGTTRAIIPVLHAAGVTAVSIGTNFGSSPLVLPHLSLWHDRPSNRSLYLFYHPRGYGGIATLDDYVVVDGFEHSIAFDWAGDNAGPLSAQQVVQHLAAVRKLWPNATVRVSTFEQYVTLLDDAYSSGQVQLPIVTEEAGDTWIHGAGADPLKVAKWRALCRLRSACLTEPSCPTAGTHFANFSRLLLKGAEHTWGSDVKQLLRYSDPVNSGEYFNWTNADLHTFLATNNSDYYMLVQSWIEQRAWAIDIPLSALPFSHPVVQQAAIEFAAIRPPHTLPTPAGYQSYTAAEGGTVSLSVGWMNVTFSGERGTIVGLADERTGQQYAAPDNELGALWYQTFDEAHSFDTFLSEYISFDMDVAGSDQYPRYDFGKSGLDRSAQPVAQSLQPRLLNRTVHWKAPGDGGYDASVLLQSSYESEELVTKYGAPRLSIVTIDVNLTAASLHYRVLNVNKTRTRLPEALWLSFNPLNPYNRSAVVHKLRSAIDLSQPVVHNGSAHLHAVNERGVAVDGILAARSLDIALVCVGYPPTLFPTPLHTIEGNRAAVAFSLWNNIWGTKSARMHARCSAYCTSRCRWSVRSLPPSVVSLFVTLFCCAGTNYPEFYPFVDEDATQQYRVDVTLLAAREESEAAGMGLENESAAVDRPVASGAAVGVE